jgi:hypothetical protein
MIADQLATLQLFINALTQSIDQGRSWTEYWKYSLLGSNALRQRLSWFESLFAFNFATNIALNLLGNDMSGSHPATEDRWRNNVRTWNNCAIAFSKISLSHTDSRL